jgi:hypothetical protein
MPCEDEDHPVTDQLVIPITHCSDRNFMESFRRDLCDSTQRVLVLSPFLTPNRASQYYPVFRSLTTRQVTVRVYARPKSEQPESLRLLFDAVERGLSCAGVEVHLRRGMHEKIGVVDGCILWHGSLNILSHNDTRESMLRIESRDVVEEVLGDLGLVSADEWPEERSPSPGKPPDRASHVETAACPECGASMLAYADAGLWICRNSPSCPGTAPLPVAAAESRISPAEREPRLVLPCPICETPMEVQRGVVIRVYCPKEACGFALDPRLAAGILRVLRRRQSA